MLRNEGTTIVSHTLIPVNVNSVSTENQFSYKKPGIVYNAYKGLAGTGVQE